MSKELSIHLNHTIREIGSDRWIFQGETMLLRLRGRNASLIVAHAETLRMTGYLTHLNVFLAGVVAGATFSTMEKIAVKIGEDGGQKTEFSERWMRFKECKTCGVKFHYGPGTGKRITKVYCSTRCRTYWHREQKSVVA